MGDRCYLRVEVLGPHRVRFCELVPLGIEAADAEDFDEFDVAEANYGLVAELEAAALEGLCFHGHSSEGGDYGAAEFCGFNGELHHVEALRDGPAVLVGDDGQASPSGLDQVREYRAALREVVQWFELERAEDHQRKARASLIEAAAEAVEVFGDDALEEAQRAVETARRCQK